MVFKMNIHITPFMKQCFVTAAVAINTLNMGCVLGFPAILLPQLNEQDSPMSLTTKVQSWIVSVIALSILAGNLVAPPLMGRLGRKVTHYVLTILFLISWVITALATSVEVLILGRVLQGVAVGVLLTLRSALIGECTSPRNRGAFLAVLSVAHTCGIFVVHLIGSIISWQRTALACASLSFISFVMIVFTPESPAWLLSKGKYEECKKSFRWLRGQDEEEELDNMIKARLAFEKAAKEDDKSQNLFVKLGNIVRKREFYKPIVIMFTSNNLMQFSGAPTMNSYSTVIIGLMMGPKANVNFWMVFIDTQRLILNIVAVFIINKVRRRVMVLTTGVLSVACHIAIAIYVYCRINGWAYEALWLPIVLLNLQFVAVSIGTTPMPQVLAGEVFPLQYRAVGVTISQAITGMVLFSTLNTFPVLTDSFGLQGTYAIYSGILLVNLIILMILLPETKGKTLQQIEDRFRGRQG